MFHSLLSRSIVPSEPHRRDDGDSCRGVRTAARPLEAVGLRRDDAAGGPVVRSFAGIHDPQATIPVLLDATVEFQLEQLDRKLGGFAVEPARQFIARCRLVCQRIENLTKGSRRTLVRSLLRY